MGNYCYEMKCFSSAREALRKLLQEYIRGGEDTTILLPSYIGWSPNEGSGIYDPICELGLKHTFYSLAEGLVIDINNVKRLIKMINGRKMFLLVHYFGYVDPRYKELIYLLRQEGVFIIEDAAHALYTHFIDGLCGLGDCIIYSFHKMLPFSGGGAVCTKNITESWWNRIIPEEKEYPFYKYELGSIAAKRKENALYWEKLFKSNKSVELLRRSEEYKNQTPQTFPVLLNHGDRYKVYQNMNNLGYGIISLYHTMIKPIADMKDAVIDRISNNILNFPVHQDIGIEDMRKMYDVFVEMISKYMESGVS